MTDSKDTYNFCFVRHPYTWWPSFYEWSKNTRFSSMERESPDFESWLNDYGPFWLGLYSKLVSRYTGTDQSYASDVKMHFVGKTENLFEDLYTALSNAGEVFDPNEYHKLAAVADTKESLAKWANKQEYVRGISDEAKELIYNTERPVFDLYGYEK